MHKCIVQAHKLFLYTNPILRYESMINMACTPPLPWKGWGWKVVGHGILKKKKIIIPV